MPTEKEHGEKYDRKKNAVHGGKRNGAGRKSARIDLGELEKLCSLQCTDEDVAAFFGVTVRTIERRRQKPTFAAAMESGRAKGRLSVRRSLFAQANNGNTPQPRSSWRRTCWATGMSAATNTADPMVVPSPFRTRSILRGFRPRISSNCRPWSTNWNATKERSNEHPRLRLGAYEAAARSEIDRRRAGPP